MFQKCFRIRRIFDVSMLSEQELENIQIRCSIFISFFATRYILADFLKCFSRKNVQ